MEVITGFKKNFSLFIRSQIYFLKLIIKEHPKLFFLFSLLTLFISLLPPVLAIPKRPEVDDYA